MSVRYLSAAAPGPIRSGAATSRDVGGRDVRDLRCRIERTPAQALAHAVTRALRLCDGRVHPAHRRATAFAALDAATRAYVKQCRAEGQPATDVLTHLSDATRAAAPRPLRPAAASELRVQVFHAFFAAYYERAPVAATGQGRSAAHLVGDRSARR